MIKLKFLFIAALALISCASTAQTTIMTNHTNNNGNGSITFNVQNTNTFAITITDISCHLGTSATNNLELLYNTSPYIDNSPPWSFGTIGAGQNGWVSAGTGIVNSNTANGVVTALSNLCLTIPAGATYQLGFSATTLQYMTLTSGAGINTFSGGGVNLTTGDGIGWGGTVYPSTPANYPRGFIGGITFVPTTPGTAPSIPVLSAVNGQICAGNSTTLSITSGNLNSATAWKWYNTSCGTGSAGTGTSIVVSPVSTTTYYARGEGGCGYTMGSCATVSVVVNPLPAVTVNSGTVCS
ncbi:MAG: immunoglobulin domain-containing protein, partial [Bacteroidia bacterium]